MLGIEHMSKNSVGRKKHIPQRTCVVCRTTSDKRTLTRIVRTADAGVQVDPTGKRNGRGAYLCDQLSCWKRALESDILTKALRVDLTPEDKQSIEKAIQEAFDVHS